MEDYDKANDLYKYLKALSYVNKCEFMNNYENIC
jgi:hypothetical protein